jgi:SAM-dependent methyltransferase
MSASGFGTWEQAVNWLRSQPDRQELVRACYFDAPLSAAAERYWSSAEWGSIREVIGSGGGRVLDIGAGMGIASYALARDGWTVTAVEPDPSGVVGAGAIRGLAQQAGLGIEVVEDFGETLPFADGSFDLVHARQVLHHAKNLEQFVRELFRVVRPGGRLIATREHVISGPEQMQAFLDGHALHSLYGGENAFTLPRYLGALEAAGFRIQKVLAPFDSPINYAPMDRKVIGTEIKHRLGDRRLLNWGVDIAMSELLFPVSLRLLSKVDRRPGRLYSFVAVRQS